MNRFMYDTAIIGGGAAGLIAAGFAAKRGLKTAVIERNEKVARKVMITGKGRCNLTNDCTRDGFFANVMTNPKFLYSAYSAFTPDDTMALFENLGVPLKTERGNRVFPQSDKAVDIVDALYKFAVSNGAEIMHGRAENFITENGEITAVMCHDGSKTECKSAVIATGGVSYPKTGSTGDGYVLAKQMGHSIVPPSPSLVGLEIHEGFCADLQGLSLKNTAIKVVDQNNGKTVYSDMGEMLFTHYGVSGPMILSASAHIRGIQNRCKIIIDLKPALDEHKLNERILRDFGEFANRDFINSLNSLLPKKLVPVIVRLSKIEPRTRVNQITKQQRETLVKLIKSLTLTVTDFRPIDEAVITSGGVNVREIEPKTMRSKLCRNLYFAGEVIDVDALTGGFNLQIAFSTGCIAGENVLK